MQFVLDAQLPPLLAKRLTAAGFVAIHMTDRLQMTATDLEVAALANEHAAIVMSKDSDFVDLLARGVLQTGLVWVRCGNVKPATLWSIVEAQLPAIEAGIAAGQRLYELR